MHILSDPIPFIRSSPERFLRQVPVQAHELALNLVSDAILLTGAPVTVCRGQGDWWIVGCEADWLAQGELAQTPLRAFSHLLPLPEAGDNSMRSEVLLSAFAETVITVGCEGRCKVLGELGTNDEIWNELESNKSWLRAVAFRLPSSR